MSLGSLSPLKTHCFQFMLRGGPGGPLAPWSPFGPAGPAGPAGPTGPGPWYTVSVYGLPGTSGTQPFENLSQPYWKEKQQLALITFTVFHLDLVPRSVNVVLNDSESRKKVKNIWLEHSSMGLNWGKIVAIRFYYYKQATTSFLTTCSDSPISTRNHRRNNTVHSRNWEIE